MSLYVPEIRSQKPEVRSGHICFVFRGHVFIWGGFNVSDYKFNFCCILFVIVFNSTLTVSYIQIQISDKHSQ